MGWQYDYAKQYADKLHEMGYCAKVVRVEDACVVAYAHRPFSRPAAEAAYAQLTKK